jgi:hypothetical protein
MRIKGLSEGAGGAEAAYTTIGTLERLRTAMANFVVSCMRVQGELLRNISVCALPRQHLGNDFIPAPYQPARGLCGIYAFI